MTKDTVRKRTGPKQYLEHAEHVLEQTQSEAYFNFRAQHPEVVISQRKFEQLKPYFVKGARERDRRSCLCRKHEEARLVFNECVKFRKNVLKEAAHADSPPVPSSLTEAVELTLCPKPELAEHVNIVEHIFSGFYQKKARRMAQSSGSALSVWHLEK